MVERDFICFAGILGGDVDSRQDVRVAGVDPFDERLGWSIEPFPSSAKGEEGREGGEGDLWT
jgi:hypothetical protein